MVQTVVLCKPWAKSMGEADFRTSTARKPLNRFSWNLKYITNSETRHRTLNFRGYVDVGGLDNSLTHKSFCPFLLSLPRPQVASLDAPRRTIRHCTSFWPRKCLLVVGKMNFDIWPPLPPKNVKIRTLRWRSMDNCSRPKSETVSHIQFKLGTGIAHTSGITWHYSNVKRSKDKVTTSRNVSG